jgi:hypothetical protein
MADSFDPGRNGGRWKLRLTNDVSILDLVTIGIVAFGILTWFADTGARVSALEDAVERQEKSVAGVASRVEQQRDAGSLVLQRLATIEANQSALAEKMAEQTQMLRDLRTDIKNDRKETR